MITVSGKFAPIDDGEKSIFLELRDASPVK